ncbi:MAG: ribosome biogenesis GTPase YlqF [Clostridia bacterium]|nr:ribosome biogenesis GTPase YlqF [Clostridia bacterium]
MNIQWFPGHMTKTRRMIEENIRLCDCVVELCDARCPKSSRNPDLPRLTKGKKLLLVINKCDIADPVVTQKWLERYKSENINVIASSSNDSKGIAKIFDAVREMMKDEIEKNKLKGFVNKPIRIMVCGIPNVGKSSFINKLYGKAAAKAGDRPGVTRGKQWITLKNGMELLDTPGILWPKFDDKEVALRLAYTGAVKDEILDVEELSAHLLKTLSENYADNLKERYKIELEDGLTGYEILERVCRKRGFILKGNEVDYLRGANIVLDEFRGAKLGRISLES